ncbi:hypothetical protein I4U23_031514 [Adineta vaga]|nr:hypothetical protein I4U23_031514 [Adineta vaga]
MSKLSIRSNNGRWKDLMLILIQIKNEYHTNDQGYFQWCCDLVSNEFSSAKLLWIMCNAYSANLTIETCNS